MKSRGKSHNRHFAIQLSGDMSFESCLVVGVPQKLSVNVSSIVVSMTKNLNLNTKDFS